MGKRRAGRIEGYAIVSEDGMLATAARVMPPSLMFEADQRFFERGLDGVDVVVHGRHSQEQQAGSAARLRLMLTHHVPALEPHPSNPKALLWNPAGATFEAALSALGLALDASAGIIGGAHVFALFLNRYTVFYLTRAPAVRLPGGRPVFPDVPARTPEDVLRDHGFVPDEPDMLDPAKGLAMVAWRPERHC
jgi:dihydrofolate reductase